MEPYGSVVSHGQGYSPWFPLWMLAIIYIRYNDYNQQWHL
jgi:hypothetical protein